MTVLRELRDALLAGVRVVGDALRLLWRHWPALLTVFLLGLAARNAAMWAAVLLGRDHPVLASLLVPLAPLAMVSALVLMISIAGRSARWGVAPTGATRTERLGLLASALVPFLTVYTAQGHLERDRFQFVNESYYDEFTSNDFFAGAEIADRTLITVTSWQVGLVVAALVLKVVLDRLRMAERHPAGAVLGALVEVTWLTWLASIVTGRWGEAKDWLRERVVVDRAAEAWQEWTGALGPLTAPARSLGDLVAAMVDEVGAVVVVPVAWLTVGAVVLAAGASQSRRARIEEHRVVTGAVGRVRARLSGRSGAELALDRGARLLGRRFEDLVAGVRTVAHAGLLPVLVFCLVLTLADVAEWGSALALRAAVGPRETDLMLVLSPYLDVVTRTVYTLLVVALVVAAVDRLLARRVAEDGAEPVAQPAQPPLPTATSR